MTLVTLRNRIVLLSCRCVLHFVDVCCENYEHSNRMKMLQIKETSASKLFIYSHFRLKLMEVDLEQLIVNPRPFTKPREEIPVLALGKINNHLSVFITEGRAWTEVPNTFKRQLYRSIEVHLEQSRVATQSAVNINTVSNVLETLADSRADWDKLPTACTTKLLDGLCSSEIMLGIPLSRIITSFAQMKLKYHDLPGPLQLKIKNDVARPLLFDKANTQVLSNFIYGLGKIKAPSELLHLDSLEHNLDYFRNEFEPAEVANSLQGLAMLGVTFKLLSLNIMLGLEREVRRNVVKKKMDKKVSFGVYLN